MVCTQLHGGNQTRCRRPRATVAIGTGRRSDGVDGPGPVCTTRTPGVAGFTLVEVSIILMVVTVLSMTLLPSIGNYLRDARLARARSDVDSIRSAIVRFLEDTGEQAFRCWGNGNRETTGTGRHDPSSPKPVFVVGMLVSDGDTPDEGDLADDWLWRRAVDGHDVDTMANHLIQNTPGNSVQASYRTSEDLTNAAPEQFPFDHQAGFNAAFAWRGPYLSVPARSDPWGNRYAINVLFLDPVSDSEGGVDSGNTSDVFVLSAGPDEEIDTLYVVDGVVPGDDDLVGVISGDSR